MVMTITRTMRTWQAGMVTWVAMAGPVVTQTSMHGRSVTIRGSNPRSPMETSRIVRRLAGCVCVCGAWRVACLTYCAGGAPEVVEGITKLLKMHNSDELRFLGQVFGIPDGMPHAERLRTFHEVILTSEVRVGAVACPCATASLNYHAWQLAYRKVLRHMWEGIVIGTSLPLSYQPRREHTGLTCLLLSMWPRQQSTGVGSART